MTIPDGQELLQFPCDYVFKVFGLQSRGELFRDDIIAALSQTIPIGLDALKQRNSSGGKYLSLSIVVWVHNRRQLEEIYAALQTVEGLCYIL
jgi:uncharacterized protein